MRLIKIIFIFPEKYSFNLQFSTFNITYKIECYLCDSACIALHCGTRSQEVKITYFVWKIWSSMSEEAKMTGILKQIRFSPSALIEVHSIVPWTYRFRENVETIKNITMLSNYSRLIEYIISNSGLCKAFQ